MRKRLYFNKQVHIPEFFNPINIEELDINKEVNLGGLNRIIKVKDFNRIIKKDYSHLYILIDNGLIKEYQGANLNTISLGLQSQYKIHEMNSSFNLTKLSKYDKKKAETKGNYELTSTVIQQHILYPTYLKLSVFEKFRIDYQQKKTIFHEKWFKPALFVSIIIPLLIWSIKLLYNSVYPQNDINNQSSIEVINNEKNLSSSKDIKADSIIIKPQQDMLTKKK